MQADGKLKVLFSAKNAVCVRRGETPPRHYYYENVPIKPLLTVRLSSDASKHSHTI